MFERKTVNYARGCSLLKINSESAPVIGLPCYENAEYVIVEPKDCCISSYRYPQNGILAVASNLNEHEAEMTAEFDFGLFGLTGTVIAMDGFTEKLI